MYLDILPLNQQTRIRSIRALDVYIFLTLYSTLDKQTLLLHGQTYSVGLLLGKMHLTLNSKT